MKRSVYQTILANFLSRKWRSAGKMRSLTSILFLLTPAERYGPNFSNLLFALLVRFEKLLESDAPFSRSAAFHLQTA
ncbi:hypothetical protein ACLB1N_03570 [Escherichia coli]